MRTWFYQVREAIENASRRGLGRVITGPDAAKLKLDPKRKWRLALAVIAMGGSNSADIAQLVHEHLLLNHGAIDLNELLTYGVPLPEGNVLVGIYLDDFLVSSALFPARWPTRALDFINNVLKQF